MEGADARARGPSQLGVPWERTGQIWCAGGAARPLRPQRATASPVHRVHPFAHLGSRWSRRKKASKLASAAKKEAKFDSDRHLVAQLAANLVNSADTPSYDTLVHAVQSFGRR